MVFGEWTQQQALRPRDHVYIRSGYSSPGPASCSQHTLLRVPGLRAGVSGHSPCSPQREVMPMDCL